MWSAGKNARYHLLKVLQRPLDLLPGRDIVLHPVHERRAGYPPRIRLGLPISPLEPALILHPHETRPPRTPGGGDRAARRRGEKDKLGTEGTYETLLDIIAVGAGFGGQRLCGCCCRCRPQV